MKRRRGSLSFLVLAMTAGCGTTEPSPEPSTRPTPPSPRPAPVAPAAATVGFRWLAATPESQGMCGSTKQLGCTKTLSRSGTASTRRSTIPSGFWSSGTTG